MSNEIKEIIAMTNTGSRVFVATRDSVYEMIDGQPVIVMSQADMRRCDEEYELKKAREAGE